MPAGAIGSCWQTGSWSDTAWEAFTWAAAAVATLASDLNTRLRVYLATLYGLPQTSDLTAMVVRNLRGRTGDMNNRFRALIQDASS